MAVRRYVERVLTLLFLLTETIQKHPPHSGHVHDPTGGRRARARLRAIRVPSSPPSFFRTLLGAALTSKGEKVGSAGLKATPHSSVSPGTHDYQMQ